MSFKEAWVNIICALGIKVHNISNPLPFPGSYLALTHNSNHNQPGPLSNSRRGIYGNLLCNGVVGRLPFFDYLGSHGSSFEELYTSYTCIKQEKDVVNALPLVITHPEIVRL